MVSMKILENECKTGLIGMVSSIYQSAYNLLSNCQYQFPKKEMASFWKLPVG